MSLIRLCTGAVLGRGGRGQGGARPAARHEASPAVAGGVPLRGRRPRRGTHATELYGSDAGNTGACDSLCVFHNTANMQVKLMSSTSSCIVSFLVPAVLLAW